MGWVREGKGRSKGGDREGQGGVKGLVRGGGGKGGSREA